MKHCDTCTCMTRMVGPYHIQCPVCRTIRARSLKICETCLDRNGAKQRKETKKMKTKRWIHVAMLTTVMLLPLLAEAQTVPPPTTLTWDAYTPPADFRDLRVSRGTVDCAAQGPLQPLVLNGTPATIVKPATGAFPTSFTDPTTPQIDGTVCYELAAFDTAGNFSTSNRASKVLNLNPPPAVQNLRVQ